MASELTRRIERNAQYQKLIKARNALGWSLTILVFVAYYGFIVIVAFDKSLFATPLGAGMTTTWGIPLGIGIILLTVVLTAIYVRKANNEFDPALKQILEKEVQS